MLVGAAIPALVYMGTATLGAGDHPGLRAFWLVLLPTLSSRPGLRVLLRVVNDGEASREVLLSDGLEPLDEEEDDDGGDGDLQRDRGDRDRFV